MATEIEGVLAEQPFLAGMKAADLSFLAGRASRRQLRKDQVLFPYGAPAEEFYLVLSGSVTMEVAAIEGPALVLQSVGAGGIIGWSWLFPPYKWTFQGRSSEDTEVLAFDGKAVRERCEADPAFGYDVLKRFSTLMSERLGYARQCMIEAWSPPGFA
ncbi:MAG TPA: Crp/Fnr family transcriptional regulator [Gammaproteobacteria bacterium]|nr:Crp/Fnr family transcriptional regulator [Gammaproteobacteria bacterium]